MRRALRRLFEPSLMRRLLLAQLLLLALVWSLAVGFVVYESSKDVAGLRQDRVYDAALVVADRMADRPAQLRETFRYIELALGEDTEPALAPRMILEHAGQTLFRSADVPAGLRVAQPGTIELVHFDGKAWHARARESPGGMRITLIVPADEMNIFVTLNSRGFYLLPMLISIPFLALPAWLSIRLALRPWNAVAREVGSRGPHDLAPLSFRPRHRELRAMVENIDTLMRRLSEAAARERAFIADAAHELRTPLAAMRVNVEALQAQASEPRQRELLGGIVSSVARASRLVGQLLNLMRSDAAGAEQPETLALDALLQDRMAALSCLADARGVELALEAEPALAAHGWRESLTSLIDNLVDNAIKYSPQGGTVEVRLRREGDAALLTVTDEGPGIAPALRERVFDRFFRDPRQTQGGSGLGLAIARAAVERHGGAIGLEGKEAGSGLRAWVKLPLL